MKMRGGKLSLTVHSVDRAQWARAWAGVIFPHWR